MTTSPAAPPSSRTPRGRPPSPRLRPNRRHLFAWSLAWIVAALYTALWLWWIHRNTAIPFFDQANYVWKVYSLAEKWRHVPHWYSRLNPNLYLDGDFALRPPLLMLLPAVIGGGKIGIQTIAVWWLLSRVLVLMLGLWALARAVGSAAWVPIALAAFLATRPLLLPQPSLYMMDLPFESFALLLFGCAALTLRYRSAWAAWAFEAAALALFMVKSQGLVFLAPFAAFIALERLHYQWRLWRSGPEQAHRRLHQLAAFALWGLPHLVALVIIGFLLRSPYGQAITEQYALGSRGYWTSPIAWADVSDVLFTTMPPWLLILAGFSLALGLWNKLARHARFPTLRKGTIPILVMAIVGFVVWMGFNLRIAYTFDSRVVWSIQGVMIAALAILAARSVPLARIATMAALLVFALSVGVTAVGFPTHTLRAAGLLGSPVVLQHPAAEFGLKPFMAKVEAFLKTHVPRGQPAGLYIVVNDDFVDSPAFALAGRDQHRGRWPSISFRGVEFGTGGIDVAATFAAYPYFITKSPRFTVELAGNANDNITALNALIANPASPLHPLFDPVLMQVVHEPPLYYADPPMLREDTLTFWHLRRGLTPAEVAAGTAFIRGK
jgi:hypothetical protein